MTVQEFLIFYATLLLLVSLGWWWREGKSAGRGEE
ncbi:MAG: hypothetical protein DKINENOH_02708 [bacterium]|nr:hypothetical protein [bacterium]